jgi:hypothetical protein
LETVPLPEAVTFNSAFVGVGVAAKVAVQFLSASMVTAAVLPVALAQSPVQPVKLEEASGVAVKLTGLPFG